MPRRRGVIADAVHTQEDLRDAGADCQRVRDPPAPGAVAWPSGNWSRVEASGFSRVCFQDVYYIPHNPERITLNSKP